MIENIQSSCPKCGQKGRKVKRVTPGSLLTDEAKNRFTGDRELRFCKSEECDVVYFGNDTADPFTTTDVRVPIFQKTNSPSRLVCYCFEHTVQSIDDEVERNGASEVPDSIADKCKRGLDRCEEMNPQGSCCLGNVHQVVKTAVARTGISASAGNTAGNDLPDCCIPEVAQQDEEAGSADDTSRNVGLWSAGGALVAAVLSSVCCWLPLALIGFGASAAGVAGFFETYRVLFLGVGAQFEYQFTPSCCPECFTSESFIRFPSARNFG